MKSKRLERQTAVVVTQKGLREPALRVAYRPDLSENRQNAKNFRVFPAQGLRALREISWDKTVKTAQPRNGREAGA
jgi:hypothetical protein